MIYTLTPSSNYLLIHKRSSNLLPPHTFKKSMKILTNKKFAQILRSILSNQKLRFCHASKKNACFCKKNRAILSENLKYFGNQLNLPKYPCIQIISHLEHLYQEIAIFSIFAILALINK